MLNPSSTVHRVVMVLLQCLLLGIITIGAAEVAVNRDDPTVVGARIVTCSGCRLNSLHEVRTFIREEMRTYPAVDILYVHGRDPIIEFVNQYNRVVKKEELAPLDRRGIHMLLQRQGIHAWTPKPRFVPFPFPISGACVAWRQTGDCTPDGPREDTHDDGCEDEIDVGRSGYCECIDGRERVGFSCTHMPLKCVDVCASAPTARGTPLAAGSTSEDDGNGGEF